MTPEQILTAVYALEDWELSFNGKEISKEYHFKDFSEAMAFANKIADLANKADHHPELKISWGKVLVTLTTHDTSGVSEKDLELAKEIDAAAIQ